MCTVPNAFTASSTQCCAESGSEMSVRTKIDVALAFELLHRARGAFLDDLGHHDLGAFGQEPLGVREADALPRAGDDRDLVLETSHAAVSYFFRRAMRLKRSVTTGSRRRRRRSTPSP